MESKLTEKVAEVLQEYALFRYKAKNHTTTYTRQFIIDCMVQVLKIAMHNQCVETNVNKHRLHEDMMDHYAKDQIADQDEIDELDRIYKLEPSEQVKYEAWLEENIDRLAEEDIEERSHRLSEKSLKKIRKRRRL